MKIYGASKIWHAGLWKDVRSQGFDITGRWIDIEGDSESPAVYQGHEITREDIWDYCLEDVTAADAVIIYCGADEEEQRGVIMEAGHAIGQGKPVYCINTCKTFSPCAVSDVAFTHHRLWNWVGDGLSFYDGFLKAYWMASTDTGNGIRRRVRLAAKTPL